MMSIARDKLANNIIFFREKIKHKTRKEMSEDTGLSYSYLRSLEHSKEGKNPSMETLDRLAKYFEIEVHVLFM